MSVLIVAIRAGREEPVPPENVAALAEVGCAGFRC
jgi:hypothetical protein